MPRKKKLVPPKMKTAGTTHKPVRLTRRGALTATTASALATVASVSNVGILGCLSGVLAGAPTTAQAVDAATATGGGQKFRAETVRNLAEALSRAPFKRPQHDLPAVLKKLTYDQYRDVRYRPEQAIWRGDDLGYELQLFSLGFLYDVPVDVTLVENGKARPLKATPELFNFGPLVGDVPADADLAFSGFRIHSPVNSDTYLDEYAVFQGASYFRLVARGQIYGLSARGLAVNTARPEGEEFPFFRAFWIEKPKVGDPSIVVHALLDSKSVTGAYRFTIASGDTAVMDVKATLYPRRHLDHVGIAPLTSMFLFGSAQHRLSQDFRPSVHDSEGLAIYNGAGENLWRPLTNPKTLQVSSFVDNGPKGFGLAQRDRSFANYEDLEAHYEQRPTAWIEPKGNWGKGFVELVEIPTQEEIHDNIVAYWKPLGGVPAGKPYELSYRITWGIKVGPPARPIAQVLKTRVGAGPHKDSYRIIVDFSGDGLDTTAGSVRPNLSASDAKTSNLTIQPHPETKGVRVSFQLHPGDKKLSELRLSLSQENRTASEVWLFRWTRS
jgi:periplasmic glucans biosynthesis protein